MLDTCYNILKYITVDIVESVEDIADIVDIYTFQLENWKLSLPGPREGFDADIGHRSYVKNMIYYRLF